METELKKSFRWEIDNFSDRNNPIKSEPFSSGGCEWFVIVHPKGCPGFDGHLSLFLNVFNVKSLRLGWKRRAYYSFAILNQSGEELDRSPCNSHCRLFCAEVSRRGYAKMLPLTKLLEKGFLENNKLTIQVYMNVIEVVHQGLSTENDILEYNGVHILASQVISRAKISIQHPGFDIDFQPKNQEAYPVYFTLFFCLIETLSKSPHSLSLADLSNAQNQLTELTKAGFKLDFLRSKLEELYLETKKAVPHGSLVQQLEERVKNVELTLSEKIKYQAAVNVSSFGFIDFLIKRFFLSCFSISKH